MSKLAAVKSPYRDKLLAAHQYQGSSNDCGPFCIAIAVNALKKGQLEGHMVGEQMNGWSRRGPIPLPRRIKDWATMPWGVADELRQQGFQAHWHPFSSEDRLRQNLASGLVQIVIIGEWKKMWAHYMLLTDYHPQHGWGFVNSASNKNEIFWMPAEKFSQQWNAMGRQVIEATPH